MPNSTFDHITHQLPSPNNDGVEIEVWCGGTEPPTLVKYRRDTGHIAIELFRSKSNLHEHYADLEPIMTEGIDVSKSDIDAFDISRAATKVARIAVGLNPDYKGMYATARDKAAKRQQAE